MKKQNNFTGAISYLTQAQQNGFNNATVQNALQTSRFWYTMGEASQAFEQNEAELAAAKYKEALAMRPRSREALRGGPAWRASLAAMPPESPTDKLAHIMAYPDVSSKTHKAKTAADLQRLLDPENEPFAKTTKLPPLPSYGPDPYNGGAQVAMVQPQPALRQTPLITAPATTVIPVPSTRPGAFDHDAGCRAAGAGIRCNADIAAAGTLSNSRQALLCGLDIVFVEDKRASLGRKRHFDRFHSQSVSTAPGVSGLHSGSRAFHHPCDSK